MSLWTPDAMTDFGLVSLLLLGSHLLRSRVRLLQIIYMPSSVIAGLVCLVGGKQGFDFLPFSLIAEQTTRFVSYPSVLVVFLFATLFLGKRRKKHSVKSTIEHAGDTFFLNLASLVGQYGFALLFGILVLGPLFPGLRDGFAVFLPMGFIGGYGTAAAFGGVLEQGGWEGAQAIGYASATVGILAAVFAGIAMVNIATRRGWTRIVRDASKMPESMLTGFVPEKERASMGHETVSPIALDPLTWHIAIVGVVGVAAFLIRDLLGVFELPLGLPVFCIALLVGAVMQKCLDLLRVGEYVDRHVIHRIGSFVTDYLVAFGIGSITIQVVLDFALPLTLLFIFGFVFNVLLIWYVARRICRNFWFERAMAMYGWSTGSVATSVVLLRILDPDMRTQVLEDFGLAYFGISFFEIAILSVMPTLIVNGVIAWPMAVLIGVFFACILLSRRLVGWFTPSPTRLREGEQAIMKGNIEDA